VSDSLPARGLGLKRRPHTTKGAIVFAIFTVASIAWRVFDAWSNLEFIGQKAGLFWRILHFLFATQAGANTLVIIFVTLLVSSLLFQFERRPSLPDHSESSPPAISVAPAPQLVAPDTSKQEPKPDLALLRTETVVPDSPSSESSGSAPELASLMSALFQPRSAQGMSIKHSACGIEETLVHSGTMAVADAYERTYGDKEDYVCAGVAYVKFYRDDNAGGSSVNVFAQIEFLDPTDLVNPLFVIDKGYWFRVAKPHWDRAHFEIGDPAQLIIAIIRPDNLILPYSGHNIFGGDEWEFAFNGKGFTAKEVLIRIKLIARTWGGEAAYRGTFEYVLTTGDAPSMRHVQAVDSRGD
jgi:hypothetical protein